MATSIDDNAADENLYKLFGEMSVIQYTSSDRLVALAKKYYKSGAVDEDITYGSTFYLN